jgi:GNAT superfamily N-acetyltransferase
VTLISPYEAADRAGVLAVFRSNAPRFFAPSEEDALAGTLDDPDGPHWVVETTGEIVGYGGFEVGEVYSRATLCWGMISAARRGTGLGRRLLAHRAAAARRAAPTDTARRVVDTTQDVAGFYGRCGFERVSVWPRGYRAGFDLAVLRMAFGSAAMTARAARA